MTVLIAVLLSILVGMSTPIRRALAGYWWSALHNGQASSYLYGNTTGNGSLRVHENRRDVFLGVRLKGEDGRQAIVARINSTDDNRTRHVRNERVSIQP